MAMATVPWTRMWMWMWAPGHRHGAPRCQGALQKYVGLEMPFMNSFIRLEPRGVIQGLPLH